MITKESRFKGCLVGLAVGDAVGTTLEFKRPGSFEPITDMVGGGPFNLNPDKADIRYFGLKSSVGNLPGPGGDIRSPVKNNGRKASIRRSWKRKERAEGKRQCSFGDMSDAVGELNAFMGW